MMNDSVPVYISSKFLNHKIRDDFNPIPKILNLLFYSFGRVSTKTG